MSHAVGIENSRVLTFFVNSAALVAGKSASKPAHTHKFRESENTMSKASDEGQLGLEEVRLVADLRIMHAKVYELFEVVSGIKKRHDEGAIRRCSRSRHAGPGHQARG